jgi:hypothetical protein
MKFLQQSCYRSVASLAAKNLIAENAADALMFFLISRARAPGRRESTPARNTAQLGSTLYGALIVDRGVRVVTIALSLRPAIRYLPKIIFETLVNTGVFNHFCLKMPVFNRVWRAKLFPPKAEFRHFRAPFSSQVSAKVQPSRDGWCGQRQ